MVFIQLYVTNATNNRYFDVPLYGIYDINIIGLQFHHTGGATSINQIESDIIRFQQSSRPQLLFMNNPSANLNYNAALESMASIKNADFNGKILMYVTNVSGAALDSTWTLLLNLEVTASNKAK